MRVVWSTVTCKPEGTVAIVVTGLMVLHRSISPNGIAHMSRLKSAVKTEMAPGSTDPEKLTPS